MASDSRHPITGVVITLNEAADIEACLASLGRVCSELLVVDSGSSDDTCARAERAGARVIHQPYLGDGPQKNVGPAAAANRWVLSIDADERLTDGAVAAIRALDLARTPHDAFALRRRNHIGSRWVRVCGWYPDYCLRLFDRDRTRFSDAKQHAWVTAANPLELDADLEHHSFANVGELYTKAAGRFSNRSAKIFYREGRRVSAFAPAGHGLSAFLRKYLLKRGFLGGLDGLSVSLSAALNAYLKYARLLEYQRDAKVREAEDFEAFW